MLLDAFYHLSKEIQSWISKAEQYKQVLVKKDTDSPLFERCLSELPEVISDFTLSCI